MNGPVGRSGATGSTGPRGVKGDSGPIGPIGLIGIIGISVVIAAIYDFNVNYTVSQKMRQLWHAVVLDSMD